MKLTGIIAEYNPFHSGHEYHIRKSRERTGSDFSVVVISGDFVQRGEPAIFSKYLRTRMALTCGADLVLEMPAAFAVSSAEDFAACGVSLLTALGAVDTICFGSEDGEIQDIRAAAGLLAEESPAFREYMARGLKQGLSWPQARNHALLSMARGSKSFPLDEESLNRLLGSPNNLLGIEYCKAILRLGSHLKPVTIKRTGQGYHDPSLNREQASASALRRLLTHGLPGSMEEVSPGQPKGEARREFLYNTLSSHVPPAILPLYGNEPSLTPEDFSGLLNSRLLTLASLGQDLSCFAGLSGEMASRLGTRLLEFEGWEGRIRQLKTRQYTYTRISRALLHLLLGITDSMLSEYKSAGYAPYARILGFRKESKELLSIIKKRSSIPLITKTAKAPHILTGAALSMFNMDLYSAHIRQSVLAYKHGYRMKNEYTQPVCIL